ncbi:hypothetical protein Vretimale_10821 [Volvox reticuliferus]|uniref:Beta-amylase n=1 Tax=Volvox reticuliferus TaxID=1737510 RepID=A0A8J4GG48_9CHLO|nr:hypothetical protein Vretimale_10821 [Volvox reticuliferus]
MCWTPVRQSSVVQKATPIYFRSRPFGRNSATRMGSASGAELAERAFNSTFREDYHPYCNVFGDISGTSVQTLRGSGTVQLPSSTSTPCFLGCGSRVLPRQFSQQLYGAQTSPTTLPRELEAMEQRANRGPLTYVMLPLDTVNADGIFRYAGSSWFSQALQLLVASGAHGVAMDFWWGAVERSPGQYNWAGYKQALEIIKQTGLKVQVVLSFHACGGNVGDTVQIPLPEWVLQCGEADPDLFFADRPRNGGLGNRNREYISIWADDAPGVLRGRSPMQCYEDLMISLRENFSQELGTVIDEVIVGAGPCGELRLPSYVEANGWRFPGAGEFQCYDRRALASLAQAAREAGHPEWGYTGPHDAGEYNSIPEHTGFFSQNGSWNTPYGRFFLEWYSSCLLRHGERLLTVANQVFASRLARSFSQGLQTQGLAVTNAGNAHSQSLIPSLLSSGRTSTSAMSLNRATENGTCGGGDPNGQDCAVMRPPPPVVVPQQPQLRRQADGAASISPSCTCSSISTCTTASSSSGAGSQAGSGRGGSCPQGLNMQHSLGSAGGLLSPRTIPVGEFAERDSGGSGTGASTSICDADGTGGGSTLMDVVGAVLSRGAGVVAACAATELLQVGDAGGAAGNGSGGNSNGGGGCMRNASSGSSTNGVGTLETNVVDATMIEVEPSDASHTSIGATEVLLAPPVARNCSGPLCRTPSAIPSGGPSPLAAAQFGSSESTLADAETMYGQGGAFSAMAAAAIGAVIVSGGTARMDLCNSTSSMSTEYHVAASGGGVQPSNIMYMDVATSLVADGDDESDVGTSCGTGVPAEDADELFDVVGSGRVSCLAERDRMLVHVAAGGPASVASESGARRSEELGLGLAMGAGMHMEGTAPSPPKMAVAAAMAMAATIQPQLASPTTSCLTGPSSGGGGGNGSLHLAIKIAGIHWWYRSRSHAAELTAGYYNVDGRDGYAAIVDLCARHRANLVLTCVEMCDSQHPAQAQCGPEGLLRQLRQLAARAGVTLSGENALPIFSTGGVDTEALDRIVQNMRPWQVSGSGRIGTSPVPSQPLPYPTTALGSAPGGSSIWMASAPAFPQPMSITPTAAAATNVTSLVGVSYRLSESGRPVPILPGALAVAVPMQDAHPQASVVGGLWSYSSAESQPWSNGYSYGGACPSPGSAEALPALRAFTFLRLVPEMLLPGYQCLWMRFMGKLLSVT